MSVGDVVAAGAAAKTPYLDFDLGHDVDVGQRVHPDSVLAGATRGADGAGAVHASVGRRQQCEPVQRRVRVTGANALSLLGDEAGSRFRDRKATTVAV